MTLQHRMKKPKFKIHLTSRRNTVFNYLVNISLNKIKLIINNDEILIHSSSSQPNFLWTIEVGRGEVGGGGGEGGCWSLKAYFCYPKGRASRCLLESCLILNLLTRMSSLVAPEEKKWTVNKQHHKASGHYVTN